MTTIVFLLEEASAREMLKGLLPQILPSGFDVKFIVFEGKQHLDKELERKLRGWRLPNSTFIVLRDQDAQDCSVVKQNLTNKCLRAGRPEAIVRVACRELESWYLGDLPAVERALEVQGLVHLERQQLFRIPDIVVNPASELIRITRSVYQKVSGSRLIGRELDPRTNRSNSFNVFVQSLREIAETRPS